MNTGVSVRIVCVIAAASILISCGAPNAVPVTGPIAVSTSTDMPLASGTAQPAPTLELVWAITGEPNPFYHPAGVTVSSQGDVYVMDTGNYRIQKYDGEGRFLLMWSGRGSLVGFLDVDLQGNIYAMDIVNIRIQKFNSSGNYLTQWGTRGSGDGQFKEPIDIAVDKQSNIYVGDYENNTVQKFDNTGKFLFRWGTTGHKDGQFSGIYSIAIDPDGNVLVAEQSGRMQKFDSNGNFLSGITLEPVGNQSIGILNMALDDYGNIYIIDANDGFRIVKVNPQGKTLATWNATDAGVEVFNLLVDIAVDEQGNLYLTDASTNTVYKFQQPGFHS